MGGTQGGVKEGGILSVACGPCTHPQRPEQAGLFWVPSSLQGLCQGLA